MRFKPWVTDDRLVLERNPDYWRSGADGRPLPYMDSFVSRYVPDLTVAVPDLQSGQLTAAENMPANQLRPLRANPRLKLIEWPWAGPTYFQMGMNVYKPPFNDLRAARRRSTASTARAWPRCRLWLRRAALHRTRRRTCRAMTSPSSSTSTTRPGRSSS